MNIFIANSGHLDEISSFLSCINSSLIIPYAMGQEDYHVYMEYLEEDFPHIEFVLVSDEEDQAKAVLESESIYIPGGNTYKLLHGIRENGIMEALYHAISSGTRTVAKSAGACVLGRSIVTSNDPNAVGLEDLSGLGLLRFSINPHFPEIEDKDHPERIKRIGRIGNEYGLQVLGLLEDTHAVLRGGEGYFVGSGLRYFIPGLSNVFYTAKEGFSFQVA